MLIWRYRGITSTTIFVVRDVAIGGDVDIIVGIGVGVYIGAFSCSIGDIVYKKMPLFLTSFSVLLLVSYFVVYIVIIVDGVY